MALKEELLHVFTDEIRLYVDRISHFFLEDPRFFSGLGNDIDLETLIVAPVDGEADSVHGYRSFFDNILQEGFFNPEPEHPRALLLLFLENPSYPVHMTGDQVPSKAIGDAKGPFEIHLIPDLDSGEGAP